MSSVAVRTRGLGKLYRIGQLRERKMTSRATLGETIASAIKTPLVRLSRGDFSRRSHPEKWALRDVSFDLQEGEVLGIVGRNGAGKSTLLKILSRITDPTCGRAEIRGRVGSLLEVGTGFHPDLTGRQNVYLNGAILGMTRNDITRRFDEIVDFAGVGQFLDTPVKRYSSGMQVRLAFAVAAHFEPDIMIIDEVLAVGDAEFQRKCLAKMDDAARGGRTVIFVSHNMNAVQRLCDRCVWVDGGRIVADGSSSDVVGRYLAESVVADDVGAPQTWIDVKGCRRSGAGEARFEAVRYTSNDSTTWGAAYPDGPLEFQLSINSDSARKVGSLAVVINDKSGDKLVNADTVTLGRTIQLSKGITRLVIRIESLHLEPGTYVVGLWLANRAPEHVFDYVESAFEIQVLDRQERGVGSKAPGTVTCDFSVLQIGEAETVALRSPA